MFRPAVGFAHAVGGISQVVDGIQQGSVQVKQYGFKHSVHLKILMFFLIIVAFAKNSKANLSNLLSNPEIPCEILENLCHFRHFMV